MFVPPFTIDGIVKTITLSVIRKQDGTTATVLVDTIVNAQVKSLRDEQRDATITRGKFQGTAFDAGQTFVIVQLHPIIEGGR
eukprot:scaffold1982_cov93-Amphora_coffeaeformis.AAC.41